jgi:hypothetical protein
MISGIAQYQQAQQMESGTDLTLRVLKSIELYMQDVVDHKLDRQTRCEAGVAAVILAQEMSANVRNDLPNEEQIIIIKVCGQIIKEINKCVRGQKDDLTKELAGIRLIRKLVSST